MERSYRCEVKSEMDGVVTLSVGFVGEAENGQRVPDAIAAVGELNLQGGRGLLIDGPASLPVAIALGHAVAHLYGFVAWLDPKLGKFVVSISHSPQHRPGDLLDKP